MKHRFIGICMNKIQENVQSDFFHSAVKRAVEYGYKILIYNAFTDLYTKDSYDLGEGRIYDIIPYEKLDGLIILGETIKDENILNSIITRAREHGVYTVSVDKRIDGCFNIEFNYRNAFEAIVRHVIGKHGCRTVNLVAGIKGNPFSEERIQCCRRILAENGLELDPQRIMYGDFWADPTARAFDEFMLSGLEMPDAFICCNDTMAITICSKLKDYGYSIPRDVIVTGFDGIFEEQYHIPRLTTAKQDVELAGEKAIDAIVSNAEGRESDNFCLIDHKVVWSHSCGCKPIDYLEASGQISPLFKMADADNSYDTYMSEFNTATSSASGIDEVAQKVLQYNTYYGYYYYALNLNEDFMNISDVYENFITVQSEESSKKRLILCESCGSDHYPPYFDEQLRHFDDALETYNVFLHWAVHFQEKFIGYGVMGLSTGCDGHYPNDDLRHIIKYTRNLNHVLEIANSQSVLKKVIAKLQDLYIRDHVTGLYNRRGFYTELQQYITRALEDSANEYSLIIVSVDMDGLKLINDTYGHAEGDIAIKAIASAMVSVWGEDEICSRFGGDEFTLACITKDEPEQTGEDLVSKILAHMESFNNTSEKPYKVSASFGIHYGRITPDLIVDNLIKAADDLMYKEKAKHKESRYRSSVRK